MSDSPFQQPPEPEWARLERAKQREEAEENARIQRDARRRRLRDGSSPEAMPEVDRSLPLNEIAKLDAEASRFRPDPKPTKRVKDPGVTTEAVRTYSDCQVCGKRAATGHHLVGKDLGGDDVIPNIASLCGSGTTGCHGLVQELDKEACSKLRVALRSDQVIYVLAKKGKDFLDRYYPLPGAIIS